MRRYYSTFFDRNYLVKGVAFIESLHRHEKNDFELFVVCLDELTRIVVERLHFPRVTAIPLHDIEAGDLALNIAKHNRSLVEYYWTASPTISLRILERNPRIEVLNYLDADLFFFSSPDPIWKELNGHSVLIHGHRFPPRLKSCEKWGKYNAGMLCFRNDPKGMEVLYRWREESNEWCYYQMKDGNFANQTNLDKWTERFDGVGELQNIGAGLSPWNHEQYSYNSDKEGRPFVNGIPVTFYHFHALEFVNPYVIVPIKNTMYPLTPDILRLLFLPYAYALHQAMAKVQSVVPSFSFGLVNNEVLTPNHTFIARKELADRIQVNQTPIKLDENWNYYKSNQLIG